MPYFLYRPSGNTFSRSKASLYHGSASRQRIPGYGETIFFVAQRQQYRLFKSQRRYLDRSHPAGNGFPVQINLIQPGSFRKPDTLQKRIRKFLFIGLSHGQFEALFKERPDFTQKTLILDHVFGTVIYNLAMPQIKIVLHLGVRFRRVKILR